MRVMSKAVFGLGVVLVLASACDCFVGRSGRTLQSLTLSPSAVTMLAGGTRQLAAIGTYSDGSETDLSTSVVWSSSDETVATVSEGGLVLGIGAGNATITAAKGGLFATAGATVSGILVGGAVQNQTLSLRGEVGIVAGYPGSAGSLEGFGSMALLGNPGFMVFVGNYLYFTEPDKHTVRRLDILTGDVTTIAGTAGLTGTADGFGSKARFNMPQGIETDGTYLYVCDTYNYTIRRITIATGEVDTLAGIAAVEGDDDSGGDALPSFSQPTDLVLAGGFLYVTEHLPGRVRKVSLDGTVSTFSSAISYPIGICASADTLYVGSAYGAPSDNWIHTLDIDTGAAGQSYRAQRPRDMVILDGFLYVSRERGSEDPVYSIVKIDLASGATTTVAGSDGMSGSTDGSGAEALFTEPYGLALLGGTLYVADAGGAHTIRSIANPADAPQVSTVAGVYSIAGGPGPVDGHRGEGAMFNLPHNITTDGANLYVSDHYNNRVRKIVIATGEVSTLAGDGQAASVDGLGEAASFTNPTGITTDGRTLYVADHAGAALRRIDLATKAVTTLSIEGLAISGPRYLTMAGSTLFLTQDGTNGVVRIDLEPGTMPGTEKGTATVLCQDQIGIPWGITTDGDYLYLAGEYSDGYGNVLAPTINRIQISTGSLEELVDMNDTGRAPQGITTDGTWLYFTAKDNTVWKVAKTGGTPERIAGSGNAGFRDGDALYAALHDPRDIVCDGNALYIVEVYNHAIRKLE
jgi:hypothetical protein